MITISLPPVPSASDFMRKTIVGDENFMAAAYAEALYAWERVATVLAAALSAEVAK